MPIVEVKSFVEWRTAIHLALRWLKQKSSDTLCKKIELVKTLKKKDNQNKILKWIGEAEL